MVNLRKCKKIFHFFIYSSIINLLIFNNLIKIKFNIFHPFEFFETTTNSNYAYKERNNFKQTFFTLKQFVY